MPSSRTSVSSQGRRTMPSSRTSVLSQGRGPRPASSPMAAPSSRRIRNNFFRKLGVGPQPHEVMSVSERSARDIRNLPRSNTPLHYDHQEERRREVQQQPLQPHSPSSVTDLMTLCERKNGKKKQVNFQDNVTVVLIPKSFEYSSRVQAKLFHDSIEVSENIERNIVEFNAEDGDWFKACLEEDMHRCNRTGALIHPVHMRQNQYVFGAPDNAPLPFSLSRERSRHWSDPHAI